jgi:hypothetical protein
MIALGNVLSWVATVTAISSVVVQWKSGRKEERLAGRPELVMRFGRTPEQGTIENAFWLKNAGSGTAYNLKVERFEWTVVDPKFRIFQHLELKLACPSPGLLEPVGEVKLVEDGAESGWGWLVKVALAGSGLTLPVRYQDGSGRKFIAYFSFEDRKIRVIRPPRRYVLSERLVYWWRFRIMFAYKHVIGSAKIWRARRDFQSHGSV